MSGNRINVLGVGISTLNLESAREAILEAVRQRRKGYICVTGVHGVMESQDDEDLRRIHNLAFLVTPDGMPLVWLGRWRGVQQMGRVYGPDLMMGILAASGVQGVRHFFLGGAFGVAKALKSSMESKFPGLQVVGTYEPPFRPLTPREATDLGIQVEAARPDIIWVGLSTPKQERFMAEFLPRLNTVLMIGVGAAFDFHAGRVRQAPRWMQRSGLEWLFRLCVEPRRLWRRYFRIIPRFLWCIAGQLSGWKHYPVESLEMDALQ